MKKVEDLNDKERAELQKTMQDWFNETFVTKERIAEAVRLSSQDQWDMMYAYILEAVINKATHNGWKPSDDSLLGGVLNGEIGTYPSIWSNLLINEAYYAHIFSLEFCKAFFGEKDEWRETKCTCGGVDFHIAHDAHLEGCAKLKAERGYKFHVKAMAEAEDRLKYLKKFL